MEPRTFKDRLGRSFELRERVVYLPHFHPRPTFLQEWHEVLPDSAAMAVASPPAVKEAPTVDLSGIEVPDVEVPAGILSLEERLKVQVRDLTNASLKVLDCMVPSRPTRSEVNTSDAEALRRVAEKADRDLTGGDV